MKVIDVIKPGDEVFYSSFGSNRQVMVTRVDKHLGEFDGVMGGCELWGKDRQVTAIHAKDGSRYSCYNGVAILD